MSNPKTDSLRFNPILTLALVLLLLSYGNAQTQVESRLTSTAFDIRYSDKGITDLRRVDDVHNTNYIAAGSTLGPLILRYRCVGDGEWQDVSEIMSGAEQTDSRITYTVATLQPSLAEKRPIKDLKVDLTFSLQDQALDWTITLINESGKILEIGDLGVPMRLAERTPRNRSNIYTQKLLRHSYVAGYGSWIFWHRANVVGPFLVMTTGDSTKLEYFDNSGRVFTPYIHATLTGAEPMTRARAFGRSQPWRLPLTRLRLAPKGQEGSRVRYSFKFQFAPDFDGVRGVLYEEGLFDTHVLPGMALPVDLPAMISLHTQIDIEAIESEYPEDTRITYLGERGTDNHIYQVRFQKLGKTCSRSGTATNSGCRWNSLSWNHWKPSFRNGLVFSYPTCSTVIPRNTGTGPTAIGIKLTRSCVILRIATACAPGS